MKVPKKVQSKSLTARAKDNTTVTKKVAREEPKVIKSGIPLDHAVKRQPATVGMSKGVTKNMDNYESLRVDVWLTDEVRANETVEQAYARIEEVIDSTLENAVMNTVGE